MSLPSLLKPTIFGLGLLLGPLPAARAQQVPAPAAADTLHKYEHPTAGAGAATKKTFFQSRGFRATIVPAVLIGYGISTINGHGFYSSYQVHNDIRRVFGGYHNHLDNYLQFAPYFELGGVLLAGVESKNDRANLALVVLKSEAIMLASVYVVKNLTKIERPDGSDNFSFPSGHTAQAFLAASIVHTELRDKSQWYGVGAYAIATGVASLRMINDKHWESDVFAGAGFGILSAHLAYLTHRYRWGHRPLAASSAFRVAPLYYAGAAGLALRWQPR